MPSAASSTSRASRAGSTSSSAAPKTTTLPCRSSPCCAPAKTRSIARASAIPTNWPTAFPCAPEDLFGYSGIIIGSVAADYFTPLQQELLREYVDRRGGGILFLGGRASLSDGGWGASSLNELLPTFLPPGNHNFHRNPATVELTAAGIDSPITRLLDDPEKNAERWKKLTYLADYEDPGSPKPGATVLADMNAGHRKLPLLITQNYGHGRTAILATGGTWRWQMSEALGDPSHDLFWQQLLRWLVAESPGPVTASMPARLLHGSGPACSSLRRCAIGSFSLRPMRTSPRTSSGRTDINALVDLTPSQDTPGQYQADWTAEKPGAYLAEVDGGIRRQPAAGTGQRRVDLSARRRRRRELSHRAEPPPARTACIRKPAGATGSRPI